MINLKIYRFRDCKKKRKVTKKKYGFDIMRTDTSLPDPDPAPDPVYDYCQV
jgi:hypothetical protein